MLTTMNIHLILFILNNSELNHTLILNLLGIFLTDLFLIFYVVIFSVKFNSGITIISMILCYVVIKITDNINKIKFFLQISQI